MVSLSGPINRFRKREAQAMGETLLDACQRLTAELGGTEHYAPRKPGGAS